MRKKNVTRFSGVAGRRLDGHVSFLAPAFGGRTLALLAALTAPLLSACGVPLHRDIHRSVRSMQLSLWPGTPPDVGARHGSEYSSSEPSTVAGRSWTSVRNVSVPTITVFPPLERNTGAAVIVFPGGGYEVLAIDLEGTEICKWLISHGITCVLLKYRVPAIRSAPNWGAYPQSSMALDDAQRAIGLVRYHSRQWRVRPNKIGVLGFSAGGHLVAAVSTFWRRRLYRPIDEVDKESSRPDFAAAIYPGHLWIDDKGFRLNPTIRVTARTPPTFLVQAEDDSVDSVKNSIVYFLALKAAGVPAELHIYARGGHAFGLRPTSLPITHWPQLFQTWLHGLGAISNASS